MSRLIVSLLFATALLVSNFTIAAIADTASKRTVSVTGVGTVNTRPDTASISLGVVTEAETAKDALEKNTAAMSRVIIELKGKNVEPKDIQTTNVSLRPKLQHFKDGKPPVITGYQVTNSVRIIVRDLKSLGAILDQAVSVGSNQVNSIAFTVDEPAALQDEARRKAIDNARHKAELYAAAGKTRLGKIMTISESHVSVPHPRPLARAALEAGASSPVPVEAGEQEITATVSVVWELVN